MGLLPSLHSGARPFPKTPPTPRTEANPTWCRNTCCCFCCTATSPRAVREEREGRSESQKPCLQPSEVPQRAQYLGGRFDEPLLLLQGRDDGDVAHRLVGVLLVLGDTHSREALLRSCLPGVARLSPGTSKPLCHGQPCLLRHRTEIRWLLGRETASRQADTHFQKT